MTEIKLIIFDLDGTLVDAYPAIVKSFNYALCRLGYPGEPAAVIRRAVGRGDENLLKPFVKKGDLEKAVSIYRRHHKGALLKGSRLFPKVKNILRYLRTAGYKIAVASNRPTKFSWILIRHLKIARYFDYVLCADELKYGKPHPEILNKIRQRFSLKPSSVLYVGDMVIDARAGRRAKIRTIIVTTGSSRKEEIRKEKPFRIIHRITDLLDIL